MENHVACASRSQTLAITDGFNSGGTQTCSYGADDLSRLASVNCMSGSTNVWGQNFTYDPFGNLTKTVPTGATGIAWMPGYNASTNQYTLAGTSYDGNGNLLDDTFHDYAWDAYGKLASIDSTSCGTNGTCMTYDAFGNMVEKNVSGTYKEVLYSPVGKTAIMSGQTTSSSYMPLPGGATEFETNNGTGHTFWHKDWLGSARFASLVVGRTVSLDRAFAPFGEAYDTVTGGTTNQDFTGDTQDTIAGLFDTPNRELSPNQGRWLSPDPAGLVAVNPTNPQSWNRYAYALNNPLRGIDPNGLFCQWVDGSQDDAEGDGGASYQDCVGDPNNEGTWIDTTSITVNGDDPGNIGDTFENGEQVFPEVVIQANCTASSGTTSIVTANATTNIPTIAAGGGIGDLIAGPPGAFLGGILGSLFGICGTASYVPSTNGLYAGPNLVFAPALGGGNGANLTVSSVPPSQNPDSIASSWDFSATFQPSFVLGLTVTKSPGSGPSVRGPSVGTRVPVSFGASYSFTLKKGGC